MTGVQGSGLVLIHGAGLGGFLWNDLVPHLKAPDDIIIPGFHNKALTVTRSLCPRRFRQTINKKFYEVKRSNPTPVNQIL